MKRIVSRFSRRAFAVFVFCTATSIALPAQTFATLYSFCTNRQSCTDGRGPVTPLVQGTSGDGYGTTAEGGTGTGCSGGCGTVFKTTPSGTLTTLYNFCAQGSFPKCDDGSAPSAGLVQAGSGDLYGTTAAGGANSLCPAAGGGSEGCGTIFKITPSGRLTTVYSFCAQSGCTDGWFPTGGLVLAASGDLYGTTYYGGATPGPYGSGTVFKITPSGTLTTLYSFCAQTNCADGEGPRAALVQVTKGDFYGTTEYGGINGPCALASSAPGCGTVFKITPSGTLTMLYSFCAQSGCSDGQSPNGLVQDTNGNLYGTTGAGGAGAAPDSGTIFKITPGGTLTTLYTFCSQSGCPDGRYPSGVLVQATSGDLFGTTEMGGHSNLCNPRERDGCGTIFKITLSGALTTLHSFCSQNECTDGSSPEGGLIQGTNGDFYGTTSSDGADGGGTVFSLSVGLGPFVKTQTTSGQVGAGVNILGTDLTGATSVTFNGTAATFTVVSQSLITTTVPTGATTGTAKVVTPSGTLSSNVPFRVLP